MVNVNGKPVACARNVSSLGFSPPNRLNAESVLVKFSGRLDSSLIVYVSADPYAGVMMNDCEGTDVFQWNYST